MARKTLTLSIDLEGAAFQEGFGDQEVAMILKSAAARIDQGALGRGFDVLSTDARPLDLIDTNGNKVGTVEVVTR